MVRVTDMTPMVLDRSEDADTDQFMHEVRAQAMVCMLRGSGAGMTVSVSAASMPRFREWLRDPSDVPPAQDDTPPPVRLVLAAVTVGCATLTAVCIAIGLALLS